MSDRREDGETRDRIGEIAEVVESVVEKVEPIPAWQEEVDRWREAIDEWQQERNRTLQEVVRKIVRASVLAASVFIAMMILSYFAYRDLADENTNRVDDIAKTQKNVNQSRLVNIELTCRDQNDFRQNITDVAVQLGVPTEVMEKGLPRMPNCKKYARSRLGIKRGQRHLTFSEEARRQRRELESKNP